MEGLKNENERLVGLIKEAHMSFGQLSEELQFRERQIEWYKEERPKWEEELVETRTRASISINEENLTVRRQQELLWAKQTLEQVSNRS